MNSIWIPAACFLAAALLTLAGGFLRRGTAAWCALAALCTALGILSGLILGGTLQQVLLPVAALAGLSLLPHRRGGGDGP
ncbi:MAG: hypothetical protein LUF84_03190 [Clostridiales bacterium]|nr:hypothetical protein [Clostridiales bacterium]